MWEKLMKLRPNVEATKTLVSWHGPAQTGWTHRDYHALAREGYSRNAIAYRCVRLVAEAAAAAPMVVTPANHPLAILLARPNPEQIGAELLEMFFGYLQVSGNGFLHALSLEDEPPRELYALRADRMTVIPGAQGWPLGWDYRGPAGVVRHERCPLTEQSPILHVKIFNPVDDWYGLSPLEAAACAIDIHNAGGAWAKALIDNAARPSGALVYSGVGGSDRLSPEQFARLKQQLADAHTGAENAGRPLLLEGGLDWKPMSLSPADMDFIEARHAAAREIALAFGVPPMLLGIPGDNTYANYREANLALLRQTVLPLANKTASALENWLGARWPEAGDATVRVDLDSIAGLSAEREAAWARIGAADFLSTAEKRQLAGFGPPASEEGS
jgi:HK97 family phage portal protein